MPTATIFSEVDRYRFVRDLGVGGMARVAEVEHTTLGSRHALKVLKVLSPDLRARLRAEGRLQARIAHPNVVPVTDVIEMAGGFPGLVMELVQGPSLSALRDNVRLDLQQVDVVGRGMIEGLRAAHRHGCVHRDLKPGNVLLKVAGTEVIPMLADFGLAKTLAEEDSSAPRTKTGMTMGTARYMAPEQFLDAKNVDHRADLFAMGTILYEVLTGRTCLPTGNFIEAYAAANKSDFAPVRDLVPDAPDAMVAAIEACLQPDPDHRPQDCDALLDLWVGSRPEPVDAFPAPLRATLLELWQLQLDAHLEENQGTVLMGGSSEVKVDAPTRLQGAPIEPGTAVVAVRGPDLPSDRPLGDSEGSITDDPVVPIDDEPSPVARDLDAIASPLLASRPPAESLAEQAFWLAVSAVAFVLSASSGLILAAWILARLQ